MAKQVILTGIRANNDLHIGNYMGAMLPMIDMATKRAGEYQVNLFVPDLHSFTTPIDHHKLQDAIMNNLRVFVAAGLPIDSPDVHIYRQSYVSAHSELTVILDGFTGFGEMSRMTQFKDKAKKLHDDLQEYVDGVDVSKSNKNVSVGLFNYPVLMASDILLYGTTYVPVGDDQTQHIEFARDIAERMNRLFGELFVVPKSVKEQHTFFGKDQGLRIKDLVDPTKKMSKSDGSGRGVIFLNDTPEITRKKIMSATTDSIGRVGYNTDQPGISNLLELLSLFSSRSLAEVRKEFEGQTQYGLLKEAVADSVANFLADFQANLTKVNDKALKDKLETSEKAMNAIANRTLLKVQQAVGLRPKD